MPEQDPIELLSEPIDRPEQPSPEFAADLLDHLLDDLAEAMPSDAVPLRLEATDEVRLEDAVSDESSAQLIDLTAVRTQDRVLDRRGRILAAVASAALVVLGGLALLSLDEGSPVATNDEEVSPVTTVDDESSPTSTVDTGQAAPEPADEAQQLAIEFVTARAAHDGEAMLSLLADDATIVNEYGAVVPDDYLSTAEFERMTNSTISDVSCQSLTSERVSCLFEYQSDISRHLRSAGYDIEMILTVRDGLIVVVQSAWPLSIELDNRYFVDWLGQTHPEDLAAVVDESTLEDRFTPEAGAVFAARTPEFVASTPPSIAKLVADEPRFSTFAEGLNRTGLVERLSICTEGPETVFAPTNDAFDRYIAAAGLDRDVVLGDAVFFERFLVDDLLELSGPTGLGNQATEVTALSGDTISVIGGDEPRVQGVPVLTDILDIAACIGALNGIDDIYSLNN